VGVALVGGGCSCRGFFCWRPCNDSETNHAAVESCVVATSLQTMQKWGAPLALELLLQVLEGAAAAASQTAQPLASHEPRESPRAEIVQTPSQDPIQLLSWVFLLLQTTEKICQEVCRLPLGLLDVLPAWGDAGSGPPQHLV